MSDDFTGLDELSKEYHDTHDPGLEHVFDALDGDIHSQGIKLDHRDWLDMGSQGWLKFSDAEKAAAYQAAVHIGKWQPQQLCEMMIRRYSHCKQGTMQLTLETLQILSEQHPIQVRDVNVRTLDVNIRHHTPASPR